MQNIFAEVTVDQNRHENGCAEHGKHVLQAKNQHFWYAKYAGVADCSVFFVHSKLLLM